ncbi:MAG: nitroreductase family protein [Dysgonamonadaceae bacterium]|jgi:nitroreductase|nr:nitroreductase family protein [Dysgonamonadaceae bacterium]
MSSFAELVKNRRSIRYFTEEKLKPEEVEQIMKAALMAPTAKNNRSWHFVLVENEAVLKQLSLCKSSGSSPIEKCALAVIVLNNPSESVAPIEDSAIAATYIQLQAEDLGLGSCWIQIAGRNTADGLDSEQYIHELMGIPLAYGIGCIIAIGHKAKDSSPHDEETLQWEKVHPDIF